MELRRLLTPVSMRYLENYRLRKIAKRGVKKIVKPKENEIEPENRKNPMFAPMRGMPSNVSVDRGILWSVDHGAKQGGKKLKKEEKTAGREFADTPCRFCVQPTKWERDVCDGIDLSSC